LTIKSAQHITNSQQFAVHSQQQEPRIRPLLSTFNLRLSTVLCLADSPFFHCPDPIPDRVQPPVHPLHYQPSNIDAWLKAES